MIQTPTRADFVYLADAELERATSRGLVRRAQQDLASEQLTAKVHFDGTTIRLDWSDGVRCELPADGSLPSATCSCGARETCRHLVRSVLFLRAASPAEPSSASEPAQPDADWLTMVEKELERQWGKRTVAKARRLLAGKLIAEHVADEPRAALFPTLGFRTRIPLAPVFEAVVCDCGAAQPCPHALPAILVLRGEGNRSIETRSAPSLEPVLRLRGLLGELMRGGLDSLSGGWIESALSCALELEKNGHQAKSELLDSLRQQVEADQRRSGSADLRRLGWILAALWLRLLSHRTDLERDRHEYLPASARTFVGLGGSGWWGEETHGLSIYLLDETTGQVVSTGTGRPAELGWSTAELASAAPVLSHWVAAELTGKRIECSAPKLSPAGKMRLAPGARCAVSTFVDWSAIAQRHALRRYAALANRLQETFPTIATLEQRELFLIEPATWGQARFSVERQSFIWPFADADGREAQLALRYRKERASAIEALQNLARTVQPELIFGRTRLGDSPPRIEPITLFWNLRSQTRWHCVDFDAE